MKRSSNGPATRPTAPGAWWAVRSPGRPGSPVAGSSPTSWVRAPDGATTVAGPAAELFAELLRAAAVSVADWVSRWRNPQLMEAPNIPAMAMVAKVCWRAVVVTITPSV